MMAVADLTVVTVLMFNFGHYVSSEEQERVLGYGTKFGTVGNLEKSKVIGLGAPPGFISGESEEIMLDVFHRYQQYRDLLGQEAAQDYREDQCLDGCPQGSHCSYGLCFCDSAISVENLELGSGSNSSEQSEMIQDVEPLEGLCAPNTENRIFSPKMTELEEIRGLNCSQSSDCWPYDINLECREEWCVCRQGLEYNRYQSACNIFIDVDCSGLKHDTVPAASLVSLVQNLMAGNLTVTTENSKVSDSLLAFLEPDVFSKEEITEAFCRDIDFLSSHFPDREDGSLALVAVVCGVVAVLVLLVLACICLSGCVCWCCFDSCRRKVDQFFSPNSYARGLDEKPEEKEKEAVAGVDQLEKAMTGYQPVPQHPPAGYPQANSSLPRGTSLPRNTKVDSLKRGVSPLPRGYPQLAEAPPGYPESPQKTGPPPLGYPQSPPEYPQTPTPPGFPTSNTARVTKALYPQIPEK